MEAHDAVIVSPIRTGIGKEGGALAAVPPDLLGAAVVKAVVARSGIAPHQVDDVILGNQYGSPRMARHAALLAGLPETVPGVAVNRLCSSSLQAIIFAAHAVCLGEADFIIAGGVESYSQAPYRMERPRQAYQREAPRFLSGAGTVSHLGDPSLGLDMTMGLTAEVVAERYGVTREAQDEFAQMSHMRAASAIANRLLADVTIPVQVDPAAPNGPTFAEDECVRADSTLEGLSRLQPIFRSGGTVTAGNTSKRSDAAAAVLVTTAEKARALGLPIAGRYVASTVVGVHPTVMGIGPIPATRRVLERSGLELEAIDLIELNEAFAAQALAVIRELGFDHERVNVLGGAIAHGHPSGATGTILTVKLLSELRRRNLERGLVTMCIGGGMGIAAVFDIVN